MIKGRDLGDGLELQRSLIISTEKTCPYAIRCLGNAKSVSGALRPLTYSAATIPEEALYSWHQPYVQFIRICVYN